MRASALHVLAVAVLLVIAGCAGSPQPASGTSPGTATTPPPTDQSTTAPPTTEPSTTSPPRLASLPGASRCVGVGLPALNDTDGLEPSAYPRPPTTANETTVSAYVARFETAYLRNAILAEAGTDEDMNLTRASTHARPTAVFERADGYVVHLRVSAGTTYESGSTGDRWPSVGYFVNETTLVRGHVETETEPVTAASGTVLLRCEG